MNTDFQHPDDGWYQIEAKGEHTNARAKVIQVMDDDAISSIVKNFNKEASQPGFEGMLIDQEHFKHDDEKATTAFGWLMRLQARGDGVYGQIRWTRTGQAAVDGGDYRHFSTEFDIKDCEEIPGKGKIKRLRPLRLDGLTLTNFNNNKGQKPITNRNMNNADSPPKARDSRPCAPPATPMH
jgi:phage I-like protein